MKLYEMTWCEIEKYLKTNKSMIIPAGTCEQHSKHLPLNTDTVVTEFIAGYLSQETGIILAPTLNYGVNLPCDKYFPGTCSLTEDILKNLTGSILDWWKIQGFERFYILSAHGDLFHIKALRESDPERVKVLEVYHIPLEDILEKQKGVKHACEGETSVMMFLHPELVKKDCIEDFTAPAEMMEGYLEHKRDKPVEGSPGGFGFPSAASVEKGKLILERMKKTALKWIMEEEKF